MKKYLTSVCDTCNRSIDRLVNLTHFSIDKCVITLGCTGRLLPAVYNSNANTISSPLVGVTDWYPRGKTITDIRTISELELVNLSTGSLGQIVLAVPGIEPPEDETSSITLKIKTDLPKEYRQYTYRKEGIFRIISGIESGIEKKSLHFNTKGIDSDIIEVYVNGVERKLGLELDDYQIWNGSLSLVPPNTISFNSDIMQAGIIQIDIIISKEQSSSTVEITFNRNKLDESRKGLGAYENVNYIELITDNGLELFYLFTFDLVNLSIPLNSILIPELSSSFILLAREPYTKIDYYNNIIFPLTGLSPEQNYLKYYNINSIPTLRVTKNSVKEIFPPFKTNKFEIEQTIKVSSIGISEQSLLNNQIIIGPNI